MCTSQKQVKKTNLSQNSKRAVWLFWRGAKIDIWNTSLYCLCVPFFFPLATWQDWNTGDNAKEIDTNSSGERTYVLSLQTFSPIISYLFGLKAFLLSFIIIYFFLTSRCESVVSRNKLVKKTNNLSQWFSVYVFFLYYQPDWRLIGQRE